MYIHTLRDLYLQIEWNIFTLALFIQINKKLELNNFHVDVNTKDEVYLPQIDKDDIRCGTSTGDKNPL